jgi:hypothetical protein
MKPMTELPISCELTPAELKARREGLLPGLWAQAKQRLNLNNGVRLRFAPSAELLVAAAKAIDDERQCCRFLKFVLTVESGSGDMWLDVTGPQGTAEFLATLAPESSDR